MNTTRFDIMSQHIPALQEFALNYTNDAESAKDLVQETMFKAVKYYEKFEEGTNLKGWLITIMRNTFINNYRHNTKTTTLICQVDELNYAELMVSCAENNGDNLFVRRDIEMALSKLPKLLYTSFTRYIEGYKYHEIATEADVPINTIKTRIFEARRLLKKQLYEYKNFQGKI